MNMFKKSPQSELSQRDFYNFNYKKQIIIDFLNEFKNQPFFVNSINEIPIYEIINKIIDKINSIELKNKKSQGFDNLLNKLKNLFDTFHEKNVLPDLKYLSRKYVDLLRKLDFKNFISL